MQTNRPAGDVATPPAAILLVFASGLFFCLLDTSAKYLASQGIAPPFIAWMRYAVHVVLALVLLRPWQNGAVFRTHSLSRQVVRGMLLFSSSFFNFFALKTLQLAETMAILFSVPIVTIVLAGPLLGEWAGWRRWLAVFVGLIGVLVITRPGYGTFGIGHAYALCAMLSNCFYVIMTRQMSGHETAESMIFYSALAPVVLAAPLLPVYGSMPEGWLLWAILLSMGFYGGYGHWLFIKAYRMASTTALAPYGYLQLVWVVAAGYLVFGDIPDVWTIVGSLIIVASGLYIVHRERQQRLENAARAMRDSG